MYLSEQHSYFSRISPESNTLMNEYAGCLTKIFFQPYLDLGAGDDQSLKIQVARPGIEPRSSCSASQELNHSATAAPAKISNDKFTYII